MRLHQGMRLHQSWGEGLWEKGCIITESWPYINITNSGGQPEGILVHFQFQCLTCTCEFPNVNRTSSQN